FVVAPAFGQTVPGVLDDGPVLAGALSADAKLKLAEEMRLRGSDFVAQEVVKLSTMPVWRDGYLEPRPFILRLFLAKVDGRWTV
ncbi:circularly permuted type 2 ATP-grasp protein, partial [Klebsiella michiganensis]|uniref:circularly permuted type 2 ATP-grasp protein n=1 Tax=Klebsiella michiganensis TaxID=1134687 RepID=UPI0013D3D708